jgi:hypothetical protein
MFFDQRRSVWVVILFAAFNAQLDGVTAQDRAPENGRAVPNSLRDLEGEVRQLQTELEQLRDLARQPDVDAEDVRREISQRTAALRRKEQELATLHGEPEQRAQPRQKGEELPDGKEANGQPLIPGRDAAGYPEWPRFDANAAADTLRAVNQDLRPENPQPAKPGRGRRPVAPEPKFTYAPAWTHGEFANLPNAAFSGAVVAPNKKIYFIPCDAATVLVYEPATGRTSTIALPNGHAAGKYVGGVLGSDGCIYCTPFHATEMAIVDTKTDTVHMEPVRAGRCKWRGGAFAGSNRKIYLPPDLAGVALTVDAANGNQLADFPGNPPFPKGAFSGAAIGGDGRIYFVPLASRTCFRLDPRLPETVETFGNAPGGLAYNGGVTGPDGRVYCIPCNADHVLVIDPTGPSAVPLQLPGQKPIAGRDKYAGGVLGPDGNIYCMPYAESRILVIDTPRDGRAASLRYWGDGTGEYKQDRYVRGAYHGGVLGPDGRIYLVPFNAKHLCAIGRRQDMNMNRVLSPMFNKY